MVRPPNQCILRKWTMNYTAFAGVALSKTSVACIQPERHTSN